MKIIEPVQENKMPFIWLNKDYLPNSDCTIKEIYLNVDINILENLAILFYTLFGKFKDNIIVSNGIWGNFCLDIWNPNTDEYDYNILNKSIETQSYLQMLNDSKIEYDYDGYCKCHNWDKFLTIILTNIINHKAPYSPLFYCMNEEFVFYFHHTGSIGLLFKQENFEVKNILGKATENKYLIKDGGIV